MLFRSRSNIEDYYMFLFVALVPWIFFSTSLSGGSSCIWAQKDMVKKIYFPREVLPVSYVTSQFVNMLLTFLVIFGVIFATGRDLNVAALIYLPVIMIVEYILCLGVAMISSAVTVYLRDVEYILGILAMAWQFLTPVMYSMDQVPKQLHIVFQINPMSPVIVAYRDILYYGQTPELQTLLSALALGIALLTVGSLVFGHLQKHFAEEL